MFLPLMLIVCGGGEERRGSVEWLFKHLNIGRYIFKPCTFKSCSGSLNILVGFIFGGGKACFAAQTVKLTFKDLIGLHNVNCSL